MIEVIFSCGCDFSINNFNDEVMYFSGLIQQHGRSEESFELNAKGSKSMVDIL
jgi:hypothetical protein